MEEVEEDEWMGFCKRGQGGSGGMGRCFAVIKDAWRPRRKRREGQAKDAWRERERKRVKDVCRRNKERKGACMKRVSRRKGIKQKWEKDS